MRIAFDAKRAFQNTTGLGHYSRTLISSLASGFPEHEYYLMAPKATHLYPLPQTGNIHVITPKGIGKSFRSLWRSNWVKQDLKREGIQLYHGLSHEIPVRMQYTGIRSVVTMHDLIFERYPQQYNRLDVTIYRKKFRHACRHADHIIAISEQTRQDLITFYNTPADKITVCYQSCSPVFGRTVSDDERAAIRHRYHLPEQFLLYVGSIMERKNLLNLCKAYYAVKNKVGMPLVVIGSGSGSYYHSVKKYIHDSNLEKDILFLSEQPDTSQLAGYKNSDDFPGIYQSATAMLYPSVFEGFGLPVLEALWSGLPVITSGISCLPEAGGDAALYIDPYSIAELSDAMEKVAADGQLRRKMAAAGYAHAARFSTKATAAAVMNVYQKTMR